MKIFMPFLLALILSFLIGVGLFFLSYFIAETISPPFTIINGEKRMTMPIGQVFISIIVAAVIGITTLIFLYKNFRKRF